MGDSFCSYKDMQQVLGRSLILLCPFLMSQIINISNRPQNFEMTRTKPEPHPSLQPHHNSEKMFEPHGKFNVPHAQYRVVLLRNKRIKTMAFESRIRHSRRVPLQPLPLESKFLITHLLLKRQGGKRERQIYPFDSKDPLICIAIPC